MDAKEFIKTKGITELPEQFIVSKGGYPINLTELAKLLTEFSQQPTEKTIPLIDRNELEVNIANSINAYEHPSGGNMEFAKFIADSIYEMELAKPLQSDSVDADNKLGFTEWTESIEKQINALRKQTYGDYLAGSKVKPVNEKMREGYPKINFMAYEPEYALELYKQWLNGEKV